MNFIDMFFKITFAFVDLVTNLTLVSFTDLITNLTSETGHWSFCEFLWQEFWFARKSQSEQAYQVISWTLLTCSLMFFTFAFVDHNKNMHIMNFNDMFFQITFAFVDMITNVTSETGLYSSCEFLCQEFCFARKSQPQQAYQVISWTLLTCSLILLLLL